MAQRPSIASVASIEEEEEEAGQSTAIAIEVPAVKVSEVIPEEADGEATAAEQKEGGESNENEGEEDEGDVYAVSDELREQTKVTPQQLQEMKEIFCLVDLDGGGTLSTDELEVLMKMLGMQRATQSELDQIVSEIDTTGAGEIDFSSFVAAVSRKVDLGMPLEDLHKAFSMFEDGPPGQMSVARLLDVLTNQGTPDKQMSRDEAEYIVIQSIGSLEERTLFDYKMLIRTFLGGEA